MTRSRKKLLFAAVIGAVVLWWFFGRSEARMLREAQNVATLAEMRTFESKYHSKLIPEESNTVGPYDFLFVLQVSDSPFFVRQHSLSWSFYKNRVTNRYRYTQTTVFGFSFTSEE